MKVLDRYAGTVFLFLVGYFRNARGLPINVQSIGLLKTAAIGDTVLMTGVIADLRLRYPSSKMVLFTGDSNFDFAKGIQEVDDVVPLRIKNPISSIRTIRKHRFQVFIDFGSWPRLDAILSYFSRSDFTVGFHTEGQHRHYGYHRTVRHSNSVHELENFRNLIRAIGIEPVSKPHVEVDEHMVPPGIGSNYVVFHPWPGGVKSHLKEWQPERWAELAGRIVERGLKIAVTGAPCDKGKSDTLVQMSGLGKKMVNLAGKITMAETIKLLHDAKLVISVNTGIMHIASAMNAPLVALHGPTAPRRWGPLSENAVSIVPRMPGCGYLHLGFEYPKNPPDCMRAIDVDEVYEAAGRLLDRTR